MMLSIKSVAAGVSTLAVAGSVVIGSGGVALAAAPPYDPASNGATQGTLSLYNAAGQQIVSGPLSTPPAYVQANTDTGRAGDNKASIYAATPVKGANALTWPNDLIAAAKTYPNPAAPTPQLQGALALGSGIFSWLDPSDPGSYASAFPNANSDPLWQNLYQLRVLTSGPGQGVDPARYASLSIQINTSNNTWTQVFPDGVVATTTTLNNPGQQTKGAPFNLTGTVAPAGATGTVELFDGANSLGAAPVSGGNFTKSVTLNTTGSHTAHAVFTADPPSGNLAGYGNSTSGNVTFDVIAGPADTTGTALAVDITSGPENVPVTLNATVTDTTAGHSATIPVGSVQFFDNGVLIPGSTTSVNGTGHAAITRSNFTAAASPHSFTAVFTPTDIADFLGSNSNANPIAATYNAVVCPPNTCDPQTVVVKVPAGSLTISTPYGPLNPFDLGTMALDSNGINFQAAADFPKAGDHLSITDTRAGNLPWTAYITSTDFDNGTGGTIDASGLAYTGVAPVYIPGNALNAATKPVVTNDVPSVKGAPHQFATAAHGSGSVYINGALALTAPSSTPAGDIYTATVTFTIA